MMTDLMGWKRATRRFSNGRVCRKNKIFAIAIVVVFAVVAAGCGKKAPPKPPEGELLPPPVSDLAATVVDDILEISWTVPPITSQLPLPAAGFRVLAFKENRGNPCSNCPPDFKPIGNLKVLGQLDKAAGQQTMRFNYPLDIGYRYTITVISVASDGAQGGKSNTVIIDH